MAVAMKGSELRPEGPRGRGADDASDDGPGRGSGHDDRRDDLRFAAVGGLVAAVSGFAVVSIAGTASPFEAQRLLESVLSTARFAAATFVGAGATVLALMLTLITFTLNQDRTFRDSHFVRIRNIAAATTVLIAASVVFLMFLSFPIGEAEVDSTWYLVLYYVVLFGGSVAGGGLISVMMLLYYAIRELTSVGERGRSSALVEDDG